MPNGPRVLIENACYHIIAKGNHGQVIFKDGQDYGECLNRLRKYKKRYNFLIYGYCLMANHIHILGEIKPVSNISRFMASLLRSYTAYFNNKYTIEGQLWQGRFKSKAILKDGYLLDCINYIEQKPVKTKFTWHNN